VTADSEYGTFDPLTLTAFPLILVGATFLASNGGLVSGGGGGEEGLVAGLLRLAPAHPAVLPVRKVPTNVIRTFRVLSLTSEP